MCDQDLNSSSDEEWPPKTKKRVKSTVTWASDSESNTETEVDPETSDEDLGDDTTVMPENISLTEVTSEKVVPADTFNVFKNKLTQMVAEHKACLRRMREQERADNEEFFALAMYQQTGELPSADNTTNYPPVMRDGINLMQIPAGASAAKFGRHLGCAMYGKNEDCQLQSLIIGAQRQRKDIRTQVPEDERAKFELVVHRKYPKFPETAYKDARRAANQMGLDFKLRYNKNNPNVD